MRKDFLRYIVGGVISYGIKIALTYAVVNLFSFWYFYAYLISVLFVIVVNFIINSFFIFRVGKFRLDRALKYLVSIFIFNFAEASMVSFLTEIVALYYLASITIAMIVVFVVKFFIYRYFIFNKGTNEGVINNNTYSSDASLGEYSKVYLKGVEKLVVEEYFKPNMKILDLGCGAGRTTRALKDLGYQDIIGVDISDKLIAQAKKLHFDIDFQVGDACRLDFPDNYFDLVFFSFNGIDYIYPESERIEAIKEIYRVLKKDGLFVYSSHNKWNIPRTKISIITLLANTATLKIFTNYRIEHHKMGKLITYYGDIFKERKILDREGFEFCDIYGVGNMARTKNKFLLNFFSKHIMYIFKKR